MATATELIEAPAADLAAYQITEQEIAAIAEQCLATTVVDLNDKQQVSIANDRYTVIKGLRIKIEKRRKELKDDYWQAGLRIDKVAKFLTAKLEPAEAHLKIECGKVAAEKARLQKIKDDAARKVVEDRLAALKAVNVVVAYADAEALTDDEFNSELAAATEAFNKAKAEEAERKRLADEEAARLEAEHEKLAAERAELDRQRKAQEEAQAKIDAEQKRLADEQSSAARKAELEKAAAEAAERAKVETEARLKREAEEAEARAEAEAEERAAKIKAAEDRAEKARLRAEAKRPDKEKLLSLADAVNAIVLPTVSDSSRQSLVEAASLIDACAANIRKLAESL